MWNARTFQVYLICFLPQTWNQPFPYEVLVSDSWTQYFKATACPLGMLVATVMAVVARSFLCTELGNTVIFLKIKYQDFNLLQLEFRMESIYFFKCFNLK